MSFPTCEYHLPIVAGVRVLHHTSPKMGRGLVHIAFSGRWDVNRVECLREYENLQIWERGQRIAQTRDLGPTSVSGHQ